MGASESSLYQRISATESSALAVLISQGRLAFPLASARLSMDAASSAWLTREVKSIIGIGLAREDIPG